MPPDHTPEVSQGLPANAPIPPRVPDLWTGLWKLVAGGWTPTRRFGMAAAVFLAICVVVAILVVHGYSVGDPDRWFHEGKWATIMSALMLGVAAYFSFRLAEWYPAPDTRSFWIGAGFVFAIAGIDEGFKLHEHIDIWTHQISGLDRDNSSLSSLDSYIVLAYPIAMGVLALRSWRHVLAMRSFLRWGAFGGVGFVAMAALDLYVIKFYTPPDGDILWEELAKSVAVASLLAGVLHAQPRFRGTRPRPLFKRSRGDSPSP